MVGDQRHVRGGFLAEDPLEQEVFRFEDAVALELAAPEAVRALAGEERISRGDDSAVECVCRRGWNIRMRRRNKSIDNTGGPVAVDDRRVSVVHPVEPLKRGG